MSDIVHISHYYPTTFVKRKYPKYRKSRTPIKSKIGAKVDGILHLMQLVDTKRSVVINDWQLLPAVNVTMWQFGIVMRMIKEGRIKEYNKMGKITPKIVKAKFDKGFKPESIEKFSKFLEKKTMKEQYYEAVCRTYNEGYDDQALDSLENDINCAYKDEAELGSCFVNFSDSEEGREFWEKFNEDWQNYRKRIVIN